MISIPGPLGSNDLDSWYEAAAARKPPKNGQAAKADFLTRLQKDYGWRMKRINRDLKWLRKMAEKEAKNTGLGVEDVRWWFQ